MPKAEEIENTITLLKGFIIELNKYHENTSAKDVDLKDLSKFTAIKTGLIQCANTLKANIANSQFIKSELKELIMSLYSPLREFRSDRANNLYSIAYNELLKALPKAVLQINENVIDSLNEDTDSESEPKCSPPSLKSSQ